MSDTVRTWKDLNHKTEASSVICLTSPSLHTHRGHFFSHFWGVSAFSSALSSAVPLASLSVCKLVAICWIQSLLLPQRLWKGKPWAWTSRSLFRLLCSDVSPSQPMLAVLQENFNSYFQGTSTELEEFIFSPALAQCSMKLHPCFLDCFGFYSLFWRTIHTH